MGVPMEKTVELRNGRKVVVRPMATDDVVRSLAFFRDLPEDDRVYLRADVTRPEVIQRRLDRIERGELHCLVVLDGDRIVADGALERDRREWKSHLAEMRLFVAPSHRRLGLGTLLSREVYGIALEENLEELVVRMMRPQEAVRSIVERLGFHEDAVLEGYVRDMHGDRQDLVIMRCDVAALWKKIEDHLATSDWQRTR
jgi:GNAT superfamily N-acetyltransferase